MDSRWHYAGHPQTPLPSGPRAMTNASFRGRGRGQSARGSFTGSFERGPAAPTEPSYAPPPLPPSQPPPPAPDEARFPIGPPKPTHLSVTVTTYDPFVDPAPVKKSQVPVYRINGEGLPPGEPKDPREPWAVAGRQSSRMALVTQLDVVEYKWDKNSTTAAPPAPAAAILVSNISNLTPATELHRHFAQFGRIGEHRLELDPKNGASLGLLRVRFVDDVQRQEDGTPVDRATLGGRQDGHLAALEALSRTNGFKLGAAAVAPVTVVLDRDGTKCAAAAKAELERRYPKVEKPPVQQNTFQQPQRPMQAPPMMPMPPMGPHMGPPMSMLPHGPPMMMQPGVIRHQAMAGPSLQMSLPSGTPPVPVQTSTPPLPASIRATVPPIVPAKPMERASYTRKDDPNPPMLPAGPHLFNQGPNPHLRPPSGPPMPVAQGDWSRPPPGFIFPSGPPPGFQAGPGRGPVPPPLLPTAPPQMRGVYNGRGRGFAPMMNGHMAGRQQPQQLKQRPTLKQRVPKEEDDMELESSEEESESEGEKDQLFFPRMDAAPRQHALNVVPIQGMLPRGPRSAPLLGRPPIAPRELTPRQMSLRRLLQNGMPHLTIDHSRLVGATETITEAHLRTHYKDFRPSEIFTDGTKWYLTFTTYDTARRAQLVMERKTLQGVALHAYVEPPPTHIEVYAPTAPAAFNQSRSAPATAVVTSPGKMSYASRSLPPSPVRRGAYATDRELIKDARNVILHDLLNAFERDLRVRLLETRVRKVVERRTERLNKNEPEAPAAKAEPGASVKLPSFSRKAAYRGRVKEESRSPPKKAAPKVAPRPSETPDVESDEAPRRRLLKGTARVKQETESRSGSEDVKPRISRRLSFTSSEEDELSVQVAKKAEKVNDHKALDDAWLEVLDQETARQQETMDLSEDEEPPAPFVKPMPVFDPREDLPAPDPFDPMMAVAEDEEDLHFVRLVLERLRVGESLHPDLEDAPDRQPETEHITGSARTEGYYKIAPAAKFAYLPLRNKAQVDVSHVSATAVSRAARATTRRFVAGIGQQAKALTSDADVVKFNQLRTRKKQLKFARSPIHDWGLYAMEFIGPGDMICEYVGEVVRQQVADKRERMYERQGIGSSYLFRLDDEYVVDATKKGSISRLINHSCTPNSTARIITIGGHKKIVIYAGQSIEPGDEVLYDYKFSTTEGEERIPCLCGSSGCRKYLN